MDSSPWYIDWYSSSFYHQLMTAQQQLTADFLTALLPLMNLKPGAIVLDTACRTGDNSRKLAALGFEVTGIDLSPENIGQAQQQGNENPVFMIHDIRLPAWSNYFNAAFNFYSGFGYYRTMREHKDSLRTMAQSLQPGGLFLLDYANLSFKPRDSQHPSEISIGQTLYEFERKEDDGHFYQTITVTDPSLTTALKVTEQMTRFTLQDFTELFSQNGLTIIETFGDYALGSFHPEQSNRLILLARKNTPARN